MATTPPVVTGVTRRQFLGTSAAAAAGLCVGGMASAAATPPQASGAERIGVLVDLTRCIGCRACVRACNDRNDLPQDPQPTSVWDGPAQTLTYQRWTVVNRIGQSTAQEGSSVKQQCLHCLEPACVSVCPVGALRQLDSGAVIYRQERCIGCRYCVFACPFGIPKFQWDSGVTPVIGKCQFCAQHATFDGPACVKACPTGALKFGTREELLFEARARLHARPDRYLNHIYGEQEVGGTSWLYLSGQPFERLGFPQGLPSVGLPRLTWVALKVLPAAVTVLAVIMSLASSLLPRRPPPSS